MGFGLEPGMYDQGQRAFLKAVSVLDRFLPTHGQWLLAKARAFYKELSAPVNPAASDISVPATNVMLAQCLFVDLRNRPELVDFLGGEEVSLEHIRNVTVALCNYLAFEWWCEIAEEGVNDA